MHGVLILVTQSGKTNADTEGDVPYSLRPEVLVESGINPDIVGSHLLLSKLLDLLDGPWGPVLEANTVEPLVQVDGVLAGNDLTHGRTLTLLLAFGGHLVAKVVPRPETKSNSNMILISRS